MAPSAIAAAHGMSGSNPCANVATAAVVTPTATNTSIAIGSQLSRRSRSEVS
jgi:di/tricarboxylate transporter